jgi:hypothetical protein
MKMKTDHLQWLPQLIEAVELISRKELTDQDKSILTNILAFTHNDGYHYGFETTKKIYQELRGTTAV